MGKIVGEEIGRYDPYTDKFIKNTTTDRIEIGTDGNLYRLSISNGNEFLPMDRLYTKADLVAMLKELQAEIDEEAWTRECMDASDERIVEMESINEIIQQKIDKLRKGEL